VSGFLSSQRERMLKQRYGRLRYPPRGERAWGPFYAPPRWGLSPRDYQDRADDEVLAIATIEHIEALGTIQEVVSVPGLDLAFIGVGDVATSMGHRGRVDHPESARIAWSRCFEAASSRSVSRCADHGERLSPNQSVSDELGGLPPTGAAQAPRGRPGASACAP
jgi:2-keto-3-deoxy-L-rhamnonate aldolase RhmA